MIAVLPSMIHPKQPFSDGLGGGKLFGIGNVRECASRCFMRCSH